MPMHGTHSQYETNRRTGRSSPRGRAWRTAAWIVLFALAASWAAWRWSPRTAKRVDGRLRVAVCQYDSRPAKYRWNADHALRYAKEAAAHGAGVIVLPEYSFCTLADTVRGHAFKETRRLMRRLGPRLARFCRRHRCYLFANIPHEPGGAKHPKLLRRNRTLVYGPHGRVVAIHDKRLLAAADDFAQVSPGPPPPPLELDFGRIGLMVCKDTSTPRKFKQYLGVDLIIAQFAHITDWTMSTNAPPWIPNDMATAEVDFIRTGKTLGHSFRCPSVFANKCGLEPEGAYVGASCSVGANGKIVSRAGHGGDVLYVDFELDENGRLLPGRPPIPVEPPPDT